VRFGKTFIHKVKDLSKKRTRVKIDEECKDTKAISLKG
jgi:hypothetical protein